MSSRGYGGARSASGYGDYRTNTSRPSRNEYSDEYYQGRRSSPLGRSGSIFRRPSTFSRSRNAYAPPRNIFDEEFERQGIPEVPYRRQSTERSSSRRPSIFSRFRESSTRQRDGDLDRNLSSSRRQLRFVSPTHQPRNEGIDPSWRRYDRSSTRDRSTTPLGLRSSSVSSRTYDRYIPYGSQQSYDTSRSQPLHRIAATPSTSHHPTYSTFDNMFDASGRLDQDAWNANRRYRFR